MTTRTGSTPIFATVQLLVALIGVPMWLVVRFVSGNAFGPLDIFLLGATAGWFLLINGLRGREAWLTPFGLERGRPSTQAHALVEQSIFGVGFVSHDDSHATLHRLVAPTTPLPHQLPAPLSASESSVPAFDNDNHERQIEVRPVVHSIDEVDGIDAIGATEQRIVARGDTYWSIAAEVFGDGRDWNALEELNLGREVAPGVVIERGADLRIGWSILVPLSTQSNAGRADLMEEANVR